MRIDVDEISWGVAGRTIVRGVRFGIESGHTVGLIGPNGSGKSSLLRFEGYPPRKLPSSDRKSVV